jgi:anti-sigma B factor antagonist
MEEITMPDRSNPFSVRLLLDGAVARVVASGELDLAAAPTLRANLDEAVDQGGGVDVDLTAVTFLDSTALSVLVAARKGAADRGQRLTLAGSSPAATRVIELAGLTDLYTVVEDVVS